MVTAACHASSIQEPHAAFLSLLDAKSFLTLLRPHGACQFSLSMGFSRQEYWSVLPCPPPEDLPNSVIKPRYDPGIKPTSPAL